MVGSGVSQRIYLDANVFVNYLYDESRPDLVEASMAVFDAVVLCRFFLVVSDVTVREIVKVTGLSEEAVLIRVFEPFRLLDKLDFVWLSREIAEEATVLSGMFGIHMLDAVHAAMASLNGCWLVTFDRDLKDAARRAGLSVFDPRGL